jgi:uncharacterized protein
MRVAVTGASGFIGSSLVPRLERDGHEVVSLVRRAAGTGEAHWDPPTGTVDLATLEGTEAVVHLAGAPIGQRWTRTQRRAILESRRDGTAGLAAALLRMQRPPRVLVTASAVGFYGDGGDTVLDESSAAGRGFLAEVVQAWEAAAAPAREGGIRTVHLRQGLVLHAKGGALKRMLPPFRLGLGGRLGSGRQWMSWIALEDLLRVYLHALRSSDLAGIVNAVAPNPVRNSEFTRALGRALGRPARLPVPRPALKLLFGRMADEVFFYSQRVVPRRLEKAAFDFRDPRLEGALEHALNGRR